MYTLHMRDAMGAVQVLDNADPENLHWNGDFSKAAWLTAREVLVIRDYLIQVEELDPDRIYATLVN